MSGFSSRADSISPNPRSNNIPLAPRRAGVLRQFRLRDAPYGPYAIKVRGDVISIVGAALERTEHYRPTEPRWYLSLIGVEPVQQNQGWGARLLEHGLRQCDRDHRPAYVWSSNRLNISLYQRHGFEIAGTIQVGSSPPIFPMLRQAR